ncbi:glycosyltransferase family 39 protein [Halorussus salilacus]|uniref:ArnT family glycosyltransferase n=1 Tax=Halorussus salilacus TaxID=2953750 RepID=UPI00209EE395|nr:glycosyltransferase family 39 protein [Halorussus salilacus]USZ69385.1 glycosyltransferase family 39 protein [Halorussus salilacus]
MLPRESDRRPLALALGVGLLVAALYLATNRYPAHGAGLYAHTAAEISSHGYALPETIPHYTAEGIPFSYPPLAFYVFALLLDAGVDPVTVARLLPPVLTVAYLVPTYFIGRDLLGGPRRGAAAAVLVALNPQILEWHVSSGGIVRATAFLLATSCLYAGFRLFRDGDRRWLPPAVALFGLTVLTHPTYTLFVVLSYVVAWAVLDRTPRGLLWGLAVGLGGTAVAAPWWTQVVSVHGLDVFTGAAGTHGGIFPGILEGLSVWAFAIVVVAVVAFAKGHRLLPVWLLAVEFAIEQSRFSYFVGSFVLVLAATELLAPYLRETGRLRGEGLRASRLAGVPVAVLLVSGAVLGYGGLGAEMTGLVGPDETTPEFIDDHDVEAMAWVETETDADATFVVLGDAAEWFPSMTDRTMLLGPWGVEWRGSAAFQAHLYGYENASACPTAECVEGWLDDVDAEPDYLYAPRGPFTIRGEPAVNDALVRDLRESDRYERVYRNEGVEVFRVRTESN